VSTAKRADAHRDPCAHVAPSPAYGARAGLYRSRRAHSPSTEPRGRAVPHREPSLRCIATANDAYACRAATDPRRRAALLRHAGIRRFPPTLTMFSACFRLVFEKGLLPATPRTHHSHHTRVCIITTSNLTVAPCSVPNYVTVWRANCNAAPSPCAMPPSRERLTGPSRALQAAPLRRHDTFCGCALSWGDCTFPLRCVHSGLGPVGTDLIIDGSAK
jgi:hypothetical protein